jgi:hypothetical protein
MGCRNEALFKTTAKASWENERLSALNAGAFWKEASAFTKPMVEGKLVRLEFDPGESRSDGKDDR